MMYIIIIAVVVFAVMAIIIKVLSEKTKRQEKEIRVKNFFIKHVSHNLDVLKQHQEKINKINADYEQIEKRIENLREGDDEEADNILLDIINANNKRV